MRETVLVFGIKMTGLAGGFISISLLAARGGFCATLSKRCESWVRLAWISGLFGAGFWWFLEVAGFSGVKNQWLTVKSGVKELFYLLNSFSKTEYWRRPCINF